MGASSGGARKQPILHNLSEKRARMQAHTAGKPTAWRSTAGTMDLAPLLCGAFFWANEKQMAKAGA